MYMLSQGPMSFRLERVLEAAVLPDLGGSLKSPSEILVTSQAGVGPSACVVERHPAAESRSLEMQFYIASCCLPGPWTAGRSAGSSPPTGCPSGPASPVAAFLESEQNVAAVTIKMVDFCIHPI